MTGLQRKEGQRSYNNMCFHPSRAFSPETVTAQKTSLFWLKSPEGTISPQPRFAVTDGWLSGSCGRPSELLCRNPRCSGFETGTAAWAYTAVSERSSHLAIHTLSSHLDYSNPTPECAHRGTEVGPVF